MTSHGEGEHELQIVHFKGLKVQSRQQSRHNLLSSRRLDHAIQAHIQVTLEHELQIVHAEGGGGTGLTPIEVAVNSFHYVILNILRRRYISAKPGRQVECTAKVGI